MCLLGAADTQSWEGQGVRAAVRGHQGQLTPLQRQTRSPQDSHSQDTEAKGTLREEGRADAYLRSLGVKP